MRTLTTIVLNRRSTEQTRMMSLFLITVSLIVPLPAISLMTKLQDALDAVEVADTATARSCLTAFIIECQFQSGRKLTREQSTRLINSANQIKSDLGWQ